MNVVSRTPSWMQEFGKSSKLYKVFDFVYILECMCVPIICSIFLQIKSSFDGSLPRGSIKSVLNVGVGGFG